MVYLSVDKYDNFSIQITPAPIVQERVKPKSWGIDGTLMKQIIMICTNFILKLVKKFQ